MKKWYHNAAIAFASVMVAIGLIMDFDQTYYMGGVEKILVYATPILVLFIEMVYQMRQTDSRDEKVYIQRRAHMYMFIIYLIAAATLLFLGSSFRRAFHERNIWEAVPFTKEHFKLYCNLKPFKSIDMYMNAYQKHSMPLRLIMVNIFGNLAAFMPCAVFMPVIWRGKMSKLRFFLPTVIGIVVSVELIQFVTMVGQADIDDVILNTLGAVLLFGCRPILRYLEGRYGDFYLTEQPENEVHSTICKTHARNNIQDSITK